MEIDARTSDSIALAIRFDCPVYTYEFILEKAGVTPEETEQITQEVESLEETVDDKEEEKVSNENLSSLSLKKLTELLTKAIKDEAYEEASQLRDEIDKRTQKS